MKILDELCKAMHAKREGFLATIIGTAGSTPAPADSRMLVYRDRNSHAVGTIGGGCLDASINEISQEAPANPPAKILTFQLNDDTGDTGLNCGGNVTVLFEPVNPVYVAVYESLRAMLSEGENCYLLTALSPDGQTRKTAFDIDGDPVEGDAVPSGAASSFAEQFASIGSNESTRRFMVEKEEYLLEMFHAKPPLFIFGGGHVGRSVSRCAAMAGFHITLIDDRPAYANEERFPEADAIVCEPFSDALDWMKITPAAYIVIVTRGHKHDELVLEKVLPFDAKYVGMIGSKRKVMGLFNNLTARGADPARLARVHAPIGLDIGAITPDEIAVSIVAELIAVKRKKEANSFPSLKITQ